MIWRSADLDYDENFIEICPVRWRHRHTPHGRMCVIITRHLLNNNIFAASSAVLAEVCTLLDAVLVF